MGRRTSKAFVRWMAVAGLGLVLAGCDYEKVEREIGYKGKARVNPWLAAERFCEAYGHEVRSLGSWKAPDWEDAVWFAPASVLGNESFTRRMERWVAEGGHLVVLVERADAESNDWRGYHGDDRVEPALYGLLERAGLVLKREGSVRGKVEEIEFEGETYAVSLDSSASVRPEGEEREEYFASAVYGDGRMTVVTDGRPFRNRWVGEKDHAALLKALVDASDYEGAVVFVRGSGVSLWGMLGRYLWPVLIGLGGLVVLWLWKNFSRFGPMEAATGPSPLRGYDHHLEALGDFQWRLDRAEALLRPLREQIVERGQRACARSGRRDEDFFQFLAERAEIPRARVMRALTEPAPSDAAVLTRTTADLQRLFQVLP